MERTAVVFAVDFLFGATGVSERGVGEDGDEGVQFGIEFFDADEAVVREVDGREGAVAELPA